MTLVDDVLYVSDVSQVRALNAETGAEMWPFPAEPDARSYGTFYIAPAVDDEAVYVASETMGGGFFSRPSYMVWAINRETGVALWPQPWTGARGGFVSGGALQDGLFVIGSSDHNVYALDVDTGELVWSFETADRVWASPLILDDIVYVSSLGHRLYALNLEDGTQIWSIELGGAIPDRPVVMGDMLLAGAMDNRLYAVDRSDGSVQWSIEGENWFWGTPAVSQSGETGYAADVNGNVYAFSAQGEVLWETFLEAEVRAGPALNEEQGLLAVAASTGQLFALDLADGFARELNTVKGQLLSPPTTRDEYVWSQAVFGETSVQAYYVETGRELWVYPPPEVEGQ